MDKWPLGSAIVRVSDFINDLMISAHIQYQDHLDFIQVKMKIIENTMLRWANPVNQITIKEEITIFHYNHFLHCFYLIVLFQN